MEREERQPTFKKTEGKERRIRFRDRLNQVQTERIFQWPLYKEIFRVQGEK